MGPHFEKSKPGVCDIKDTLVERVTEEGPLEFLVSNCVTSPYVISQTVTDAEGMSDSPLEIATPNLRSDLIFRSTLRVSVHCGAHGTMGGCSW